MISIHVCKKEAGLDTDQKYRDFLFKIAGVRSCKELTVEQANKVLQAMGRNRRPKEIAPKPIPSWRLDMDKFMSTKKPAPWEWRTVTDEEWSNFANYMTEMAAKKVTVVAVWEADGTKKFKFRPMKKGWDY